MLHGNRQWTQKLLEYLVRALEQPPKYGTAPSVTSVNKAFSQLVASNILPSMVPIIDCELLQPKLRQVLQMMFGKSSSTPILSAKSSISMIQSSPGDVWEILRQTQVCLDLYVTSKDVRIELGGAG